MRRRWRLAVDVREGAAGREVVAAVMRVRGGVGEEDDGSDGVDENTGQLVEVARGGGWSTEDVVHKSAGSLVRVRHVGRRAT